MVTNDQNHEEFGLNTGQLVAVDSSASSLPNYSTKTQVLEASTFPSSHTEDVCDFQDVKPVLTHTHSNRQEICLLSLLLEESALKEEAIGLTAVLHHFLRHAVEAILLPQPPEKLRIRVCVTTPT
ncbi:hypothetical protein AAY473_037281 [Plecturocebus cupreus]